VATTASDLSSSSRAFRQRERSAWVGFSIGRSRNVSLMDSFGGGWSSRGWIDVEVMKMMRCYYGSSNSSATQKPKGQGFFERCGWGFCQAWLQFDCWSHVSCLARAFIITSPSSVLAGSKQVSQPGKWANGETVAVTDRRRVENQRLPSLSSRSLVLSLACLSIILLSTSLNPDSR